MTERGGDFFRKKQRGEEWGWREREDEEIRDDTLSHTRTERERGTVRETALVREGGGEGGYSGTLEPSDMTQMHWATVQRAVGGGRRVLSERGGEEEEEAMSICESSVPLYCFHSTVRRRWWQVSYRDENHNNKKKRQKHQIIRAYNVWVWELGINVLHEIWSTCHCCNCEAETSGRGSASRWSFSNTGVTQRRCAWEWELFSTILF